MKWFPEFTVLGQWWTSFGEKGGVKSLREARRAARTVFLGEKGHVAVRVRRSDGKLFGI